MACALRALQVVVYTYMLQVIDDVITAQSDSTYIPTSPTDDDIIYNKLLRKFDESASKKHLQMLKGSSDVLPPNILIRKNPTGDECIFFLKKIYLILCLSISFVFDIIMCICYLLFIFIIVYVIFIMYLFHVLFMYFVVCCFFYLSIYYVFIYLFIYLLIISSLLCIIIYYLLF